MKKSLKKLKEKCLKENKIILLFLLLIIIFAIIDIVINRINIRNTEKISENLYTISESSKEYISKIPDDEEFRR